MPLTRSLPLRLLLFYGLGNIIDIGVYVLVGEVTGLAGCYAPIWFLVVSAVTGFTALSYTKPSSQLPPSTGEAVYTHEAFASR
jgi:amino acid transporter